MVDFNKIMEREKKRRPIPETSEGRRLVLLLIDWCYDSSSYKEDAEAIDSEAVSYIRGLVDSKWTPWTTRDWEVAWGLALGVWVKGYDPERSKIAEMF